MEMRVRNEEAISGTRVKMGRSKGRWSKGDENREENKLGEEVEGEDTVRVLPLD